MLYQIISSYSSDFISKRAVVDYKIATKIAIIIDWSQVTYESDFTVIKKQDVLTTSYYTILGGFNTLYGVIDIA